MGAAFLMRVDAMARTAEVIIEGDLSSRIPPRGTRDNFDRLAASLNRMLIPVMGVRSCMGCYGARASAGVG